MTEKYKLVDPDWVLAMWNGSTQGFITEMNAEPVEADANGVLLRMPFREEFCADEESGLLHGGLLAAAMDSAFGLANFLAIGGLQSEATIDLRVEYLRPAKSRSDIMVFAECYRQTKHVAFNRGRVWCADDDIGDVAAAYATFAITRGPGNPLTETGEGRK